MVIFVVAADPLASGGQGRIAVANSLVEDSGIVFNQGLLRHKTHLG